MKNIISDSLTGGQFIQLKNVSKIDMKTRHHRQLYTPLCAHYLVFYFFTLFIIFFKLNCNNNLPLMHMSINCHLLTPLTAAHEVSAARESIGIAEKRTINFEIFEKCEFDLTSPFLERILLSTPRSTSIE